MKILCQNTELFNYIPQRPPFVMVDKLYSIEDKKIISGLTITEKNILLKEGVFQEGGMIENMAQTAALYAGYQAKKLGKETPLGFIGGIKDLKINKKPVIGEHIFTEVEIVNEIMNVQIVNAKMFTEKQDELATCELRIFIKEEN